MTYVATYVEHKWLNLIKQSLNTHANISKTTIDFYVFACAVYFRCSSCLYIIVVALG